MGKERGATRSEQVNYRPPPVKALDRGSRDAGPDPVEQKELARKLVETLGHFGVEASIVGVVSGPHVSRFELQLAPGHQGQEGVRARQRHRLRARLDRDPHPRADPGQAGGRRRGAELVPQHGPPRRHLQAHRDGRLTADRLARQGNRRQAGQDRSGEDAACTGRRYNRFGQVGCVNAVLSSILMHSSPNDVQAGAGRPEAGRTQPLRGGAAPADPGCDQPEAGRERAHQPDCRDGVAGTA